MGLFGELFGMPSERKAEEADDYSNRCLDCEYLSYGYEDIFGNYHTCTDGYCNLKKCICNDRNKACSSFVPD